ncbi:hypothetical protein [Tuberibacillus sp. Marseille-P3662]|uniref:hypothetical protein n=1 Tax=Tuberibacillus sp. Marseille-P3662 TaxID=1965358 RepID=UPI000A1CBA91|nr:hypothetical protein [Tuberibacillus sp. Marseille-P3662]
MKKKLGVLVIVLIGFIIYIQLDQYQDTHFKVDEQTFNVKDDMQQVMAPYYKVRPNLKQADRYNIVNDVNKEIRLTNQRRTLTIDKVYLGPNSFFMLYHFNLLKTDKKLKAIPKLKVDKIKYHLKNGETLDVMFDQSIDMSENGQSDIEEPTTYQHKVYKGLMGQVDLNLNDLMENTTNQPDVSYSDYIKRMKAGFNQVKNITLVDPVIKNKDKNDSLDDLKLDADYNVDKWLIQKRDIHQQINIASGIDVKIKKWVHNYNQSYFTYSLTDDSNQLSRVMLKVNTDSSERARQYPVVPQQDGQIPLFHQGPLGTISFKPVSYFMKSEKAFSGSLTKKQLKKISSGAEIDVVDKELFKISVKKAKTPQAELSVKFDYTKGETLKAADSNVYIGGLMAYPQYQNNKQQHESGSFSHIGQNQTVLDLKDANGERVTSYVITQTSSNGYDIDLLDKDPLKKLNGLKLRFINMLIKKGLPDAKTVNISTEQLKD